MVKHSLAAGAMLVLLSSPAAAFHCPRDISAIDTAMDNAQLSETVKAEVKALRDEGEALHRAGQHREAVDKLSEAMRKLLTAQ